MSDPRGADFETGTGSGLQLPAGHIEESRADAATFLRVSSRSSSDVITPVLGQYVRAGEAHGFSMYRRVSDGGGDLESKDRAALHILYRSAEGRWTFTSSEASVAKSKGTVVSTRSGPSPTGLSFRHWNTEGNWPVDESFAVTEDAG